MNGARRNSCGDVEILRPTHRRRRDEWGTEEFDGGRRLEGEGVYGMIARYTRPEMGRIWSDENKYRCWLTVETAASQALAAAGDGAASGGGCDPG